MSRLARAHAHETLIWAAKGGRHTFNYDLINGPDPAAQVSSVWRVPTVPRREKLHGRHPTQKPLRLVRRALLASTKEGELVLDPFSGSGTTGVAAKELGRFFVGAELEGGSASWRGAGSVRPSGAACCARSLGPAPKAAERAAAFRRVAGACAGLRRR